MSNETATPLGAALAFQRGAIRQGQRTFERGMAAQRAMTEAVVRNSLGMGRTVNRTATQATRQNAVTVAEAMDLLFPAAGSNARASVEGGFDAVLDAQDTAWRIAEESAEDVLATYGSVTERQQEVVGESMSSTLDAHERVASGASDAAVEYERQAPEGVGTGRERGAGAEGQRPDTDGEGVVESHDAATTGPEAETATEPPVETPEREEPSPAGTTGVGLDDISGVGAAYARRLESAGIESVEQLRDADTAELSDATEISDERIANWQKQARHLLESERE